MRPNSAEQKSTEARLKVVKPRFTIQKLEERIAPAKGGVPGKPVCHYGYDDCCHGHHCQRI